MQFTILNKSLSSKANKLLINQCINFLMFSISFYLLDIDKLVLMKTRSEKTILLKVNTVSFSTELGTQI